MEDYTILPATTLTTLLGQFSSFVSANALIVVSVLGLAIGVGFVMRWFGKSHKKIKA